MAATLQCPNCHKEFSPQIRYFQDNYITIDPSQYLVMVNGKRVRLTPTEHRLLACLVANRGRILEHTQLLASVWGWEYIDDVDYVRIYIWRLRNKIEPIPGKPHYIISELGIGYYFNDEEVSDGSHP